ncbi:MAG: endopeptidase La [Gammaproteobacteria bacterium TMED78]|nr:MAG: endopeptidase La [Gammaproteobacteria bacterium TMED78]|tara:strand:- start:479 stop:2905 length:2427 start_codon:yes stop_codon:yes gene_type:complete
MDNKDQDIILSTKSLPLLPLRDVVVFPHMVMPLFVGREKSISAIEKAMLTNKEVFLVAQKNADIDYPAKDDFYHFGTIASILQVLKLPDGTIKVLVEGSSRARISSLKEEDFFIAELEHISDVKVHNKEIEALSRSILSRFEVYIKLNNKIPSEIINSLSAIDEPGKLADTVAAHIDLKLSIKQNILEIADTKNRLEHILALIDNEIDLLNVERKIRKRVKNQMEKSQREYYLNEQMKAIQKELGEIEDGQNDLSELDKAINSSGMANEAKEKANNELNKLKLMSPMSSEATVVRNYLEYLIKLPWKKRTKVFKDLSLARKNLDKDHFGLEQVKERILEYLAVQNRVKKLKGPILCLVGPPGVGKTSLGKSIAEATNRNFVRMSLGGLRDEAEIRGHRRTYIGSMPGKIIQNITKSKVKNPLFLLDEVDKMSMDFRGDPSSALLEVLDPEQNSTFADNYLEVDYDLSEVMFICTANTLNIPAPLLDRMEVIRIPGYTEDEKANIAKNYLVPKQISENGLKASELQISKSSIYEIIRYYSREAGVRNLEREIAKICRKVVKKIVIENISSKLVRINTRNLSKFLGIKRFKFGLAEKTNRIGQVTGLAWTEVGGELLNIETAIVKGKGKLINTGKLGDVMKESIRAAMTVVRSRASSLGLEDDFSQEIDVHIHVPEGATPKDGPSAGIGMCASLVSALTKIPIRSNVAMTGEITLKGEILPIGGLKEKLLAAHRGGIDTVLIPIENKKDLPEIPNNIKDKLTILPVKWIDEVLQLSLTHLPEIKENSESLGKESSSENEIVDDPNISLPH